jgi:hypothetical protein
MQPSFRFLALPLLLASLGVALPASAAELNVDIDIPRLDVAEYHKPYLAVWIEKTDQTVAANLTVRYSPKKNNEGTKWLKDLRQWWRRSGRELEQAQLDALAGATPAVGAFKLRYTVGKAPLTSLPPGEYKLGVEAARESGGRELVYLPFQWPPKQTQQLNAKGEHELGGISLELKP